MLVSFKLTMPNVGSWNGQWTGASRKYYVIQKIADTWMKKQPHFKKLLETKRDSWHYSWNDGWGANVTAEIIDAAEARKRRKESAGFCSYEWMIDTIKYYGKPMNTSETNRFLESELLVDSEKQLLNNKNKTMESVKQALANDNCKELLTRYETQESMKGYAIQALEEAVNRLKYNGVNSSIVEDLITDVRKNNFPNSEK